MAAVRGPPGPSPPSDALDGVIEDNPGSSVHLASFLEGLKAKYGLHADTPCLSGETQQQPTSTQPAAARPFTAALGEGSPADRSTPTPAVLGNPPTCSESWPTPQSLVASPGPAPIAAAEDAELGIAASQDTEPPVGNPGVSPEAASLPSLPAPAGQSQPWQTMSPGSPSFGDDGEDAVLKQLLQLEALEEQLARQQLQGSVQLGQDLLGIADPSGMDLPESMPGLSPASSSATWPEPSQSLAHDCQTGPGLTAGTECGATEAARASWGAQLPWPGLSKKLVQLGFPAICHTGSAGGQPEPAAVFAAMSSVLAECDRRSRHMRQLADAAQNAAKREELLLKRSQAALREKEGEVQKWKRLALQSQKGLRDAQQAERQSQRAAHRAVADCTQLQDRVAQLEHEVRAKDAEADRLQQRFASHLDKEDRRANADKAAYERLKRAYAASKGASTPKAGAAFVANAAREMRALDIVRIYEEENANLQEEAAIIRAENRVLEGQLQRVKAKLERAGAFDAGDGADEEGQARAMARQNAATEERRARLAEENAALQREVAQRPTPDQYASLQRQVDIMARQLSHLAAQRAAANSKADSDGAKPQPKQLSTREAIQRDKNLARLGLYAVEQLPKPVLIEILQDACIVLECPDAFKLCGAIKPVQETAAMVPRLQRFMDDICSAVFHRGLAHVPEQWRQDSPSDILAILGRWVLELNELLELRSMLRALLRVLGSRAGLKPKEQPPAAGDVVPLVGQLVEVERAALHSREVLEAAEAVLAAQPDVLIHRIVRQFQELFACKTLEGVLPCMNKLYLTHTEAQTFLKSLRDVLGLDAGASLEAYANRITQLLEHKQQLLGATLANPHWQAAQGGAASSGGRSGEGGEEGGRGVVVIERPRRAELQRAAEVAVDRMAAKRNFPQVEIYVPAPRQPLAEHNQAGQGGSFD